LRLEWQYAAIAGAVSVACALLLIARPAAVVFLDNKGFDLLVAAVKRHPPTNQVAIIDIDESSLAKLGPWPWPRSLIARIVQRLAASAPSVIALDIVFPEADRAPAADQSLAAALSQTRSVIGFDFVFDAARNRSSQCSQMPKPLGPAFPGMRLPTASAVICGLPRLDSQEAGTGFLNSVRDRDAVSRRIPLLVTYRGAVYPSLALSAVAASSGHPLLLDWHRNSLSLRWNGRQIPMSDNGRMLLRYRGRARTMPHYSAAEVLAGNVSSRTFAGKIVLLGVSVNGLEEPLKTSLDPAISGVEIQATAIDNLIAGDYLQHPNWASSFEIAGIFVMSFLTAWLMFQFPAPMGVYSVFAAAALAGASAEAALAISGIFISPVPVVFAAMATLAVCGVQIVFRRKPSGRESTEELAVANRFITGALGAMTAVRDVETGQHVIRIQGYLRSLCQVVSANPKFSAYLTPSMIDLLVQLAPIHDIGKVGVPDYILRKPGALSQEEFEQMKSHVTLGKKILEEARRLSGLRDEVFFKTATDIVYSHHEWWDGTGYPLALNGESIPVPGRLLAVADVYDALISKRSYKPELLHAEAVEQIRQGSGKHFDPEIVAGFLAVQEDWRRMAEVHRDEPGMAASAQ